jgi:hypothetical protein
MKSVIVDGLVAEELSNAEALVEVRDATGKMLGFFAAVKMDQAAQYAEAAAGIDPWALLRARREPGNGRSTADVMERLQGLERQR